MKKFVSILFVAIFALAISGAAFADYAYNPDTGRIEGSYSGSGVVETYVNGDLAAAEDLAMDVENGTYKVEVYENGALVNSQEVVVGETPVEPTEAPVEPTQAPVEPTQAPVEPTQAPVEPTQAPVDPEDKGDEPAPVEPSKDDSAAPATDANGKDKVLKTGEFDSTMIVIAALSIAVVGFAGVVVTKKYGKEN